MKNYKFRELEKLHYLHYEKSLEYSQLVDCIFANNSLQSIDDLPFLPTNLFKNLELKSVEEQNVYKTMTSSGTTGQRKSKIFLDKDTALAQQKALIDIVSSTLGSARVPMLILDSIEQIKNRSLFSARGAGIMGFMIFGTKKWFALDENVQINSDNLKSFREQQTTKTKFLYGFTAIIWEEILSKLPEGSEVLGQDSMVVIHGGGWKKLADKNITQKDFVDAIQSKLGPNIKVIDYYGMVEQTGSIFMGNEDGYLETNRYNDILIRDPISLSVVPDGEVGLVQVFSTISRSYPGYSLLTEDLGCINKRHDVTDLGEVKCFSILGRIPKSELRGCSNTYER